MIPSTGTGYRPEAEPLITGVCELALERAVLPYQDDADGALPGGRIDDLGLGVVLEGGDALRPQVLDLGSAQVREVHLEGPLVIFGWVFSSTLRTLRGGLAGDPAALRRLTFTLALRTLERNGFSALTRPHHLRIGFRDLVRDLDLHEGTALRLAVPGSVVRFHLDYSDATLVARTAGSTRNPSLEAALRDAFSSVELLGSRTPDATGIQSYHLPMTAPNGVAETRQLMRRLRRGFLHLLARFEPARYRAVREQLDAFGERDSLEKLRDRPGPHLQRLRDTSQRRSGRVH
jgi:hypothetical protein